MSKRRQHEIRSEKERLRAAVRSLRERNHEQRRTIEELRRTNDELRVALQASDVLVGAAMDAALQRNRS